MRKKDILIILVCLTYTLISFFNPSLSNLATTTTFFISNSQGHNNNDGNPQTGFSRPHKVFNPDTKLPLPLITDLDGDNLNEIILVDEDYNIKIYDVREDNIPRLKFSASLLAKVKITVGRRPIKLSAGKISETGKQVIVVVTESWSVLCFSHQLTLEWESSLKDYVFPELYFEEVGLSISPIPIYQGDVGSVFVGGALKYKFREDINHDHFESEEDLPSDDAIKSWEHFTHFSYAAFDGKTGALRWTHNSEDDSIPNSHREEEEEEKEPQTSMFSLPSHSYKLHVFKPKHFKEIDWEIFHADMLRQFPHSWRNKDDNRISVDFFSRKTLSGKVLSESEQDLVTPSPNVIVSRLADRIEVLHLYTGKIVCHIPVSAREATFDDINLDKVVEEISLASEMNPSGKLVSTLYIKSNNQIITNTTIKPLGNWDKKRKNPQMEFANILIYPKIQEKEIVLSNNLGDVAMLNAKGQTSWHISTASSWSRKSKKVGSEFLFPSLSHFPQASGWYILSIGEYLSIISEHGSIILEQELELAPVAAPTLGDFNNDGSRDILLQTTEGLVGIPVVAAPSSVIFSILSFILLIFISALAFFLHPAQKSSTTPFPKSSKTE